MDLFKRIQDLSAIYDDDGPSATVLESRPMFNDGGMLVKPSADGRRPGYSVDKRNNNYRVTGKRGDVTYAEWAKENDFPQTFSNKKDAQKADKQFKKSVSTKTEVSKLNWENEITKLVEEFNEKVIKDFNKGDMSKTPAWKNFLENKKLKYGSSGFYRSLAPQYGIIKTGDKKAELLNNLITKANSDLKYTPWMSIQNKVTTSPVINTSSYRTYIDALDTQADKASKAFDYLLNNDIELKVPKNLSKTMAAEGSLLRKVIHGLTGVNTRGIRSGLNQNKNFKNNFDKIEFARRGNLFTEGEGRTLNEILDNADYRMKGNISWTSDMKRANNANKNVFDYALRNFNYHQLNKTGKGQIQFYDKKTNKPINWDTLPKNKNGFRVLKPNSVYFIDSTDPSSTKWDMTKIDSDNMKWKNNKTTSGMFDEVFQAKDKYDKLLSTKVADPRNPKGKKISFGNLMSDVYQIGFSNFGNPYNIEHSDGVANKPFNNLKLASGRVNTALSALNRDTKLNKFTKDGILKVLSEGVFDPNQKNVIDTIIKGTAPTRENVLVQGKKFDQSELDMAKQKFLTNLDKNKFRRVSTVLINAAKEGGFGEAVQKICMRKKAKKGGRMFLSNGSGCPAADQDPKGFLKSVSDNPQLAKFFKSGTGQKLAGAAARVTGNVLNPTTLIGGEVAFVLGDGLNNFASGLPLDESFDRAFVFGDFGKFEKNLMNKAKELKYDDNQLNLLLIDLEFVF